MMPDDSPKQRDQFHRQLRNDRSWIERFGVACRGSKVAVRAEASFFVHLFMTVVVLLAGAALGISRLEWCLIIICIMTALSMELLNTSIERVAKAITPEANRDIRDALDIASGAVLVAAIGAAILGFLVLGVNALEMLTG